MTGLFSYPKRKLRKLIEQGEYEDAIEFGNELEEKFNSSEIEIEDYRGGS